MVHVDDTPSGAGEGTMDYKILSRDTHDPMTCIRASERLLIVVRFNTDSQTHWHTHRHTHTHTIFIIVAQLAMS